MINGRPTYHDLHITTPDIERVSIANLPFRVWVHCTRVGGWTVWAVKEGDLAMEELGSEYGKKWLVLDVAGHVICNSRDRESILT